MVKKRGLFLFGFVLFVAVFLMGFVSAVTFTEVGSVTNPDNFYSPYESWINVSTNATVTGAGDSIVSVKANFTAINSTACGNGYLNLAYVGGYWVGNCSVSSFFTNASQVTPIQKNITFVVENATGNFSSLQQIGAPVVIMLHNLGVPNMSDSSGCTRFGVGTTNLSSTAVSNFAVVNYIVQVQTNFTCMTGGAFRGAVQDVFNDALLLNLTSVNMTSSDIGSKLSNLRTTVQVNITTPKTFGASRINVNTTAFSELNTGARVTLYDVPIVYWDISTSVTGENLGKLNAIGNDGANGYLSTLGVSSWNITLYVDGFSGYNVTDNNVPSISIITPGTATNRTSFILNISVNGTGTEPSKIVINITNSTGQVNFTVYNSTTNTANCKNTTAGGEFYYCAFNVSSISLNAGNYTVNVTAWDYGGASPGNVNTLSQTIVVDTTAPTMDTISFSPGRTTMAGTVTLTEGGSGISSCTTTQGSITGSGNSWAISDSGLTCNTSYMYNVTCTDRAGNSVNQSASHFTSACSSSSSDGGGGGDDSSSGEFWAMTYYLTDNQFKNSSTKTLKEKERIMFRVNGLFHHVGAVDIYSDRVTINVSSDYSQQTDIDLGETLNFDVTGDGYYDVSVTLTNITSNSTRASFTVGAISESVPVTTSTPSTTTNQTSNRTITVTPPATSAPAATSGTSIFKKAWFWIVIVVLAGGIAAGVWYYLKIRKARGY